MHESSGSKRQRIDIADPATRPIVMVAFTAYAMKGDEARLRSAGCDGYLAKPINVALFANQVRALLAAGVQASGPGVPPVPHMPPVPPVPPVPPICNA